MNFKLSKIIIVSGLAGVLATGCTQIDQSTEILLDSGYSDIEITGYSFFRVF
jgi:hypothetical protein